MQNEWINSIPAFNEHRIKYAMLLNFFLNRATLDLNIRHLMLEKKNAHDLHGRIVRDKDRELKQLKKGEQQMRNAQDNMALIKMMLDKAQGS